MEVAVPPMEWIIGIAVLWLSVQLLRRWGAQRSWQKLARSTYVEQVSASTRSHQRSYGGSKQRDDGKWCSPNEPVSIAGTRIQGGLFYIGSRLSTRDGWRNENCLINPNLPVGPSPGNVAGEAIGYWPSYADLSPASRRAYIDWLASDRSDPRTYIGYVFLYFYGIERRLILDGETGERAILIAKVEQLLSIYGGNKSFWRYARALLDAVILLRSDNKWQPPPLSPDKPAEFPLMLRAGIGHELAAGRALNADWMLAWLLAHPETRLKTAAQRCFPEFTALFRLRFAQRCPSGLAVRTPRRPLRLNYRAASGTFALALRGEFERWGDVASLSAPLKAIEPLVDSCVADLSQYSRLLGRKPHARGTMEAAVLLPVELLNQPEAAPMKETQEWLNRLLKNGVGFLPLSLLSERFRLAEINKREVMTLSLALGKLGFAMEPDPRFAGPMPDTDAQILVFRASRGALVDAESLSLRSARLHVEMASFAANADGRIADQELKLIAKEIEDNPNLSDRERARVFAYLMYLAKRPPNFRLLSKLKREPIELRRSCALLAISVAGADGHLSADEMRLLERVYRTLGFPTQDLYSALNALGAREELPVVATSDESRGIAIRRPPMESRPPTPGGSIALDPDRLARVREETASVTAILSDVFLDEEESNSPNGIPGTDRDPIAATADRTRDGLAGLESRHARVLAFVLDRASITAQEFADLARSQGLLPHGALETINEWSFERFGEPILDDSDPIEVAHYLIRAGQEQRTARAPA